MTRMQHTAVTPESIISIPELEGPWPDSRAASLLYVERKFHPESQTARSRLKLHHVKTNQAQELHQSSALQAAFWIEGVDNMAILLESTGENLTDVFLIILDSRTDASAEPVRVGRLPGDAKGLAAVATSDHKAVLAFSASTPVAAGDDSVRPYPGSSGREYRNMPVRTEGSWITSRRTTVFCAELDFSVAKPCLASDWFDVLTDLDDVEYRSFGGVHLNQQGLAIIAAARFPKPEDISLSTIYYLPIDAIIQRNHLARKFLQPAGFHGASYCPKISHDGNRLIYLQKRESWLEDDSSLIVTCDNLQSSPEYSYHEIYRDEGYEILLSPQKVALTADASTLYFLAEDRAEMRLFRARNTSQVRLVAEPLTSGWSIASFHLVNSIILLSGSTMTLPRHWATLSISDTALLSTICSGTDESDRLRLNRVTFESIEWPGADDIPVQAWVVKPSNFNPTRRYPLLYCIHGGPNAAFTNAWAASYWANWNFVLFAEQGYIVVAPNFSGSTGFGQEYARRVIGEHGGKPYIDLEKGFEFIEQHLSFVDVSRAVALGISYGGYMVNWIQGQPLGRRFKALVAESGLANTTALYSMDFIYFESHFGGPMYKDRTGYEKFNPLNHIQNWATPTLVIANGRDYRPPVTEGITVFQILQAKGVESRLLSFPDEGHITEKPSNRLHWWFTVLDWCARSTEVTRT